MELYVVRASGGAARLELVQTTALGANVASLAVLRRVHGPDLLWVGFDRMRCAALAWHAGKRDWVTEMRVDLASLLGSGLCSPSAVMNSLDVEDLGRVILRGKTGDAGRPCIRADPSGRCVAVLAEEQGLLYVVPVRADDESAAVADRIVLRGDVFLVDLGAEYDAANIKDFAFLQGTFEPSVVLLHEPKRTWSGRAAVHRNSCNLLAISVDVRSKRHSKMWEMEKLPFDAEKVEPVPESAGGGTLVMAPSVIMQVRHGACVAALSLNCFGDAFAEELKGTYDSIAQSQILMELDAAHCRFLDLEDDPGAVQCTALLSLKGGELYFLTVAVGSRKQLSLKRAGSTVIASEIVPINDRFFVLASRLSDSLLIEYQKSLEEPAAPDDSAMKDVETSGVTNKTEMEEQQQKPAKASGKRKKRRRTAEEEAEYEMIYGTKPPESSDEDSDDENSRKNAALELKEKDEGTRGVYDDEDELGWVFNSTADDDAKTAARAGSGKWALKVKDTLTCFGPGADVTIGEAPDDLGGAKLDMVIAGGYGKNGCLAVVHQSVRPMHRTEIALEGCSGVWTVRDPAVAARESKARTKRNEAVARRNADRRATNTKRLAQRKRFMEENIAAYEKEKENLATARAAQEQEKSKVEEEGKPKAIPKTENGNREQPVEEKIQGDVTDKTKPDEGTGSELPRIKRLKAIQNAVDPNSLSPPLSSPVVEGEDSAKEDFIPTTEEFMRNLEAEADAAFAPELEEAAEEAIVDEAALHAYMLLSTPTATVVLATAADLEELMDGSIAFITDEPTLAAANVLGNQAIAQVVASGIRILMGGNVQCEYKIPENSPRIVESQVVDPCILIRTSDGRVTVLHLSAEKYEVLQSAKAGHASAALVSENAFDEYGMPLEDDDDIDSADNVQNLEEDDTNNLYADGATTSAAAKMDHGGRGDVKGVTAQGEQVLGYRNLTLVNKFQSDEVTSAAHYMTSACIYKGPIATEIFQDGLRNQATPRSGEEMKKEIPTVEANAVSVAKSELPESTGRETEALSNDAIGMDAANRDVHSDGDDEEDRMLYGDDAADDEEEAMLYGAGNGGEPESKIGQRHQNGSGIRNGTGVVPGTIPAVSEAGLAGLGSSAGAALHGRFNAHAPSEKGVLGLPEPESVPLEGETAPLLLVMTTKLGALEIRAPLLSYAVVLQCPHFFGGPACVEDGDALSDVVASSQALRIERLVMCELTGSALLPGLTTPVLVAVSASGMPLVYRAFMTSEVGRCSRSRLRLHRVVAKDNTATLFARSIIAADARRSIPDEKRKAFMVQFRNVAGRGGLFVGGPCPFFVFAERGHPRIHPLRNSDAQVNTVSAADGSASSGVSCFAELHNVNCPRGFVTVAENGLVRIGELPTPSAVNFDGPTPMKKIALRCTPHKVAYHAGSATYGVLASMPTLTTREERLARILQSLEKHDKRHYQHTVAQAEAETGDDRANRVPPLLEELHELRIYRPDTWELIKSYKLKKGEVGLAIANMKVNVFKQKQAGTGVEIPSSEKGDDGNESQFAASQKMRPKDMLVVGTGYLNGEDSSSRGRLLMFEISRQEVYTETGGVYTAFQLQLISEKELFSPVTAVAPMEGYVICGVGPQVSVYKLVGDEIVHLAFAFGQLYCTSIASLKQFVVAADMCKSVSFMYFRDRNNSVNFLGKDYENVTSYATEFLIENDNVSIVISDGRGNIHLMNYAHASVPESRGGKRLLVNGGLQCGSRINKFVRVRAPDKATDTNASMKAGEQALMFTTLDGGIGAVVALEEAKFAQLEMLCKRMLQYPGVERHAGINLEEQNAFRPENPSTVLLAQRLIDSRPAFDFYSVTSIEAGIIAQDLNMTVVDIARVLLPLDNVLSRF